MADKDRVYTLNEARSGSATRPRRERRDRAQVLVTDPPWLHEGLTVRLLLRGEPVDLFAIGVLARGVGRSTGTVRRWIDQGLLPQAEFRSPGRFPCSQHRLWTREAVLTTAAAVQELGLHGRRPRQWAGSELPERLRAAATA